MKLGIDRRRASSADALADIEKELPFRDSCATEIWMNHVFEHVENPVRLMEEIWRVGAPARFTLERCLLKRNLGDVPPQPTHWWNRLTALFDLLLEAIANRSLLWIQRAERFLSRPFGFDEIQVILRVKKSMVPS